ncbi:MAG: PIN domain-containing protein [Chloracidobacterium sp.]|nr:PIN domain-containing protein [Chloracidobacterium sp.]
MIRVVIDTGVVVSAALKDRTPEEIILTIVASDEFDWVASVPIVKEYTEVLSRKKFNLPTEVLQNWSEIFDGCISIIEPEELPPRASFY